MQTIRHPRALLGVLAFVPTIFCELGGCLVGMSVRSGIQRSRSKVNHFVFLRRVELGVPKLGHRCALILWKGSGRESGEDKEGIWIRVERPSCNRTVWEDSGLPSLRTDSQVDSSGKCYALTTNQPSAIRFGSL